MSGFDNEVVYGKNADFTSVDNQNVLESNGLATDGQIWIGTTAANAGGTHINVGTLTSPGSTITIGYLSPNITLEANGATVGQTITGNNGGALSPTAGNWNIVTSNSTPVFSGAGSTLTLDFGLDNLAIGSSLPSLAGGSRNANLGRNAGNGTTSGQDNVVIGWFAGVAQTTANQSVIIGSAACTSNVVGVNNIAIGSSAMSNYIGSTNAVNQGNNIAIGTNVLNNTLTSGYNIAIGTSSGNNYGSTESNNIVINNLGVAAESNTIRIGTQGSGDQQQNRAFMAGIAGVSVSNLNLVTIDTTTGQLGSSATSGFAQTITGDSGGALSPTAGNWNIVGGPGVTTSGSGSTLTINSVVYTNQAGTTSVTSDSGSFATAAITLTLPAAPAQGELCEFVATSAAVLVVDAPSTHLIRIGNAITSAGGTASSSGLAGDSVSLRYRAADTTWYATSVIGVWITA